MESKKEEGMRAKLNSGTLVIALIILFSLVALVSALTFIDKAKSDFDLGTYNQTVYNTTNSAVQLNLSYNNGTFTSQIFNTGSNVSLNNLSWTYQRIQCPGNMSYINKLNGYCIDNYEAAVGNADGSWNATSNTSTWASATWTQTAMAAGAKALSIPNVYPWVYVNQTDARLACSRSGKHLCTDAEWLGAANINGSFYNLPLDLSAAPYACNTNTVCSYSSPGAGNACMTGSHNLCKSAEGVYDMVGNVWEWTNETVDYTNPCSGVSAYCYWNGTAFLNAITTATAKYGNDGVYYLLGTNTGYAVQRGGDWGAGANAGPFCAGLYLAPSGPTRSSIGFRCCSS